MVTVQQSFLVVTSPVMTVNGSWPAIILSAVKGKTFRFGSAIQVVVAVFISIFILQLKIVFFLSVKILMSEIVYLLYLTTCLILKRNFRFLPKFGSIFFMHHDKNFKRQFPFHISLQLILQCFMLISKLIF